MRQNINLLFSVKALFKSVDRSLAADIKRVQVMQSLILSVSLSVYPSVSLLHYFAIHSLEYLHVYISLFDT